MPAPDHLKQRLKLAYEYSIPDERDLAEGIYRQRATAYRDEMTDQARQLGSAQTGRMPGGQDQAYLLKWSLEDAQSIRRTFNRDLERQIDRLYEANPDGKRDYYVNALEQWASERAVWKDRQIAIYNSKTAQQYAQQRFLAMNSLRGSQFRFVGPPPICDDCVDMLAMGVVGELVVNRYPTPLHPNCPHRWKFVSAGMTISINELWVG
jgi:hypothetical protein